MVLAAALRGGPSHAYLFHGPAGMGKRTRGAGLRGRAAGRGLGRSRWRAAARAGRHRIPTSPGCGPTGAHVMRVEDVDGPGGGGGHRARRSRRTRRVFVLERVDTMNDEVANRLLKTLEEPAGFVHLILLTEALGQGARDGRVALPARALRPAAGERGSRERWRPDGVPAEARRRARGCRSATRRGRATSRREEGEELRAEVDGVSAAPTGAPASGAARSRGARCSTRAEHAARGGRGGGGRRARAAAGARAEGPRARARSSATSRRPPSATAAARAPRCSTWRSTLAGTRLPRPGVPGRGGRGGRAGRDRAARAGAERAASRDPRRLRDGRRALRGDCASRSS